MLCHLRNLPDYLNAITGKEICSNNDPLELGIFWLIERARLEFLIR